MTDRPRLTWGESILAALTGIMALLMLAQVVFRYLIGRPLVFSEEAARLMFVWTTFLGAAAAFRRKAHIGIDVLVKAMPARLRRMTEGFISLATTGVLVLLLVSGLKVVKATSHTTLSTIPLPTSSLYLAIPVACSLMLLDILWRTAHRLKKRGGA